MSECLKEPIEDAKSVKELRQLHQRLARYTVLDPACGSGNFLYLAYREIKRLEASIIERLREMKAPAEFRLSFVTARNFFGIDINSFAVELAKVTLMIGRKLAEDELHLGENPLPLDNLDANFIIGDALIDENGLPTPWPKTDVIIGNPPFIGAKLLKPQRGSDYVNAVRKAYPDIPGMADYCVYWFRRAHDHLAECTEKDPVSGRAGLVGTQNIRNNKSREAGLDHIVKSGTILEAVDNQPWSGEANVHVSIVDWIKSKDPKLLPTKRPLWFVLAQSGHARKPLRRGEGNASKVYELDKRECLYINSALSDHADLSVKEPLNCNKKPKKCFQGKIPGYDEFLLDGANARRLAKDSGDVIVPYLTGRELLSDFKITRWAIDFRSMDISTASSRKSAFEYCRRYVLPKVQAKCMETLQSNKDMAEARKEHLDRWWQFWNRRDELNAALIQIPPYLGCSRVTRRPIMVFLESCICPSDLIQVFSFADDYSFGVLQSNIHFEWFSKSSRLKIESDLRYSVREVFETFPWPQSPTAPLINAVAQAGREVRRLRDDCVALTKAGLRAVYRTLELPGKNPLKDAHAALDAAVLAAYGFSSKKDLLAQILELNLTVAERIRNNQPVISPGIPTNYPTPKDLITADCIKPRS